MMEVIIVMDEKHIDINRMCVSCDKFGNDCAGTACGVWTGCAMKKAVNHEKVICKPKLVFDEHSNENKRIYNVELWHSYDGGKNFYYEGFHYVFNDYYEAESWRKSHRKNLEYDLMFCRLGNGTSVCNRAKEEYGDYQHIAHIDDCGAISWRVPANKIAGYALEEIHDYAKKQEVEFRNKFMNLSKYRALDMLNNILSMKQFLRVYDDCKIVNKNIEEIYKVYIEYVCLNGKRCMP